MDAPDDFLLDDDPPIPFDPVVLGYAAQLVDSLERSMSIVTFGDPVYEVYQPAMLALLATFALPAPPVESFATGTDDAVAHYAEVLRHKAREATTEPTAHRPTLIVQALLRAAMLEADQHREDILHFLCVRATLPGQTNPATEQPAPTVADAIRALEASLLPPPRGE